MEQKGSMLLKVSSILMIIGGICGAVGSVLMAAFAGLMTAASTDPSVQKAVAQSGVSAGAVSAVLWIGVAVLVISAVVEIIAGVKGKNNWNNPEASKTLLIFGIVCAVLAVLGNILFATGGTTVSIINVVTGLVIPVLYIIGVVQLKNRA